MGEIHEKNKEFSKRAGAGAAVGAEIGAIDAGLAMIVNRWVMLPEPIKAGILAMVQGMEEWRQL